MPGTHFFQLVVSLPRASRPVSQELFICTHFVQYSSHCEDIRLMPALCLFLIRISPQYSSMVQAKVGQFYFARSTHKNSVWP